MIGIGSIVSLVMRRLAQRPTIARRAAHPNPLARMLRDTTFLSKPQGES